ncbi:MAG: hypothetical protein BJ554DRAFT_2075 [Olpidium bornovanus]|uniref:GAG-pre-integrase domain-containing protein n=1 Tax=Olpidium bornovanus TaxID=278681 RepID=A0A8H7ZRE2_9FUNG|nr:MAG: hypothetical protein BJ554DRAFT_2075 [Olpidium bornovanus]
MQTLPGVKTTITGTVQCSRGSANSNSRAKEAVPQVNHTQLPGKSPQNDTLRIADDSQLEVIAQGTVVLSHSLGTMSLKDTLCVPGIFEPLFSIASATLNGVGVWFDPDGGVTFLDLADLVRPSGTVFAKGYREGRSFFLDVKSSAGPLTDTKHPSACSAIMPARAFAARAAEADLWHRRLDHLRWSTMKKIAKELTGADIGPPTDADVACEPCTLGRARRLPFATVDRPDPPVGTVISADSPSPFALALNGEKYTLTLVERTARLAVTYFLTNHDDTTSRSCLDDFFIWLE